MIVRVLSLVTVSILIACGPSNESSAPVKKQEPPEKPLLASASLTCENSADCPNSVGMVVIKKSEESFGTCTGFLVGEDIVATNDHCLPFHLQSGSDCSQSIEILFPGSRFRCQTVLTRSYSSLGTSLVKNDYAFFKLKRAPGRGHITIDRQGVTSRELVTIVKVDPMGDGLGILTATKCKVVLGTALYPGLSKSNSSAFLITEMENAGSCKIIHGNSGSPVFGENGLVKGIVQAGTGDPDFLQLFNSILLASKLPYGFKDYGIASNFACIGLPQDSNYSRPAECQISDSNLKGGVEVDRKEAMIKELDRVASQWGEQFPMFQWRMAGGETGIILKESVLFPIPVCTYNKGLDDEAYQGWLWGYKSSYSQEIQWPYYKLEVGLDSDLKMSANARLLEFASYRFEFGPDRIASGKPARIKIIGKNFWGWDKIIISDVIQPCTK